MPLVAVGGEAGDNAARLQRLVPMNVELLCTAIHAPRLAHEGDAQRSFGLVDARLKRADVVEIGSWITHLRVYDLRGAGEIKQHAYCCRSNDKPEGKHGKESGNKRLVASWRQIELNMLQSS